VVIITRKYIIFFYIQLKKMESRISKILRDIDNKKKELKIAYYELKDKYWFSFRDWKIIFTKAVKNRNKLFKNPLFKNFWWRDFSFILSMPFIYVMIIPIGILDIFLILYQNICFRIYKIPLVKRKKYMVYDRQVLDYLNRLQKINCLYCSYSNGVIAFWTEISGRTEKFRCPIKHARKNEGAHTRQDKFADYGDPEWFLKEFNNASCFYIPQKDSE